MDKHYESLYQKFLDFIMDRRVYMVLCGLLGLYRIVGSILVNSFWGASFDKTRFADLDTQAIEAAFETLDPQQLDEKEDGSKTYFVIPRREEWGGSSYAITVLPENAHKDKLKFTKNTILYNKSKSIGNYVWLEKNNVEISALQYTKEKRSKGIENMLYEALCELGALQ